MIVFGDWEEEVRVVKWDLVRDRGVCVFLELFVNDELRFCFLLLFVMDSLWWYCIGGGIIFI